MAHMFKTSPLRVLFISPRAQYQSKLFVCWTTEGEGIHEQPAGDAMATILATGCHRSTRMQQVAIAFFAFNLVSQSEQRLSDLAQFASAMVGGSVGSWLCHENR